MHSDYFCVFTIYSNDSHLGCRAASYRVNFSLTHIGDFHTKYGINWHSGTEEKLTFKHAHTHTCTLHHAQLAI